MADAPVTTPAALSKGQIFLRRLGSTLFLWSIVLAAIFSTDPFVRSYVFLGLMIVLAGTGLVEFYGMVERRGFVCFRFWGLANGLLLMASTFVYLTVYQPGSRFSGQPSRAADFESAVLVLFVLGLCLREFVSKKNQGNAMTAISMTLLGLMYVPWLLNFIQKINFFPGVDGRFYVLYFIVVTKFSDVGGLLHGFAHWSAQDDPAHQPRENLGGIRRRGGHFDGVLAGPGRVVG
jgi:phosphatidate cytidylyltransferase